MDKIKEVYMYLLGAFVVGISASVVILLVFHQIPETNKDLVNIALGALLGQAVTVINYFFGSSKSSADKNALLTAKDDRTTIVTDSTSKSTTKPVGLPDTQINQSINKEEKL
jgi:drug/metabolite transporter (DMT)-like permease